METINRFALIVRPKRRYLEWANALDDDGPRVTQETLAELTGVYLVEAGPDSPDREELIETYAEEIWDEQLEAWCTDENAWPKNRTPHLFRDWFDVTVIETVSDADPEAPWIRDDDTIDAIEAALSECAWCGAAIDPEQERLSLFATLPPNDPLRDAGIPTVIVSVGGAERVALLAQPDSEMAREGRDLSFALCSEQCAEAMRDALKREREAQMS